MPDLPARPDAPPARTAVRPLARLTAGLVWAILSLLLLVSGPATAQSPDIEAPDFVAWEQLADRAEAALTDRSLPDSALEALRAEVVTFRNRFFEAQGFYRERIAILREQIEALGPAPAEGESEPPEIAERRADLAQRLAQRQAPLVATDEAFRRADAIVRSIDRVLRERQAQALTRLWPTPLNPANWPAGVDTLVSSLLTVWGEGYNAWLDPALRSSFWSDLPLALGLLVAAFGLILRGRSWMETLTARLLASTRLLRGRFVAAFVLSLTQIVVPFVGLMLLYLAIQNTGLAGPTITALADALVAGGLGVVLARWLSLHLFPRVDDPGLTLRLDPVSRKRARAAFLALAVLAAGTQLFEALIQPDQQRDAAVAVLLFPFILMTALMLWRFAVILRRHAPAPAAPDAPAGGEAGPSFVDRSIWLGAKLLMAVAVAAPVLAAVGYVGGARQLLFPAIETVGLAGLVMVLQRLITAIYEAILGLEEGSSNALVPALAGMLLTLGALPIAALLWGVREAELFELIQRFREGFRIGETRIAPGNILSFFVVFGIGFVLTRAIQGALSSSVLPKTKMERGAQKSVVSGVGYLGIFVAALVAFSTAGIDLSGLAIVAGALSVGIGFGLQNIVSNFVSGLILLIERPVAEGDWVEVGTTQGYISRISVRSTVIETFDKSEVIVPNSDLISGRVTNFTRNNKTGRVIVPVSVAYGTDTARVEAILRDLAEAHPLVALDPRPAVLFMRFGADGLEFEIRAILRDVGFKLRVQSDLNHEIARRFAAEGIEIPFAQRDIWLRNPEALTGAAPRAAPAALAAGAGALAGASLPAMGQSEPVAPELLEDTDTEDGSDSGDDR